MRKYFIVLHWFLLVSLTGIVTAYAYFDGTPLIGVVRYEPNADINTNNLRNDPPSRTFFATQNHIYEGQLYIHGGESIFTNYVCGISQHWELQDSILPNPDHTFFDGPRVDYLTALGDVRNLQDGYIGTLGNFSKSFMGISSWSDVKVSFIGGTQYGNYPGPVPVWFTSTEESPHINNDFSRMSDLEWRYRVLRDWASNGSSDSVWIYVTRQYSYTRLINDGSLEGSNLWGALPSGTGEVSLGEIETKGYAEINLFKWNTDESVDALGKLYIYSNGDVFLNTNPVLITVTSPNGGEEFSAGTPHEITWTSEGDIEFVKIEYSINNGTDWIEIALDTENDGSYDWNVPCKISTEGLVRISDVDSNASDTSDDVFSIIDDIAPNIEVSVSPNILWPPNHKMVPVAAIVTATDNCDTEPAIEFVSIVMNESDETITYDPNYDFSVNDGQTSGDIQVVDDWNFYLRSERSGKSNGRTYTITYRAIDVSGNESTADAEVLVPHSMQ